MTRLTLALAVLAFTLYPWLVPAVAQGRGGRGLGGPPSTFGTPREPSGVLGSPAHPGSEPAAGQKPVSDLLTEHTKLASKVQALTGLDAQTACSGFKNLGECVATAHVSHNLGIDFATLKGKVTGAGAESLGHAIHEFNPHVNAEAEANKAHQQAHHAMQGPGS